MAKRGHAPKLRVVEPQGKITQFSRPVAVEFLINWEVPFHNAEDSPQTGWALAYTPTAGLVVWVQFDHAITAWLPAAHIRRR